MFNAVRKLIFNGHQHQSIHELMDNRHDCTPDLNALVKQSHWPYFAYHDKIINSSVKLWDAFTLPKYSLWKKDLGKFSFPIAIEPNRNLDETRHEQIRGHLLRMPTEALIEIDHNAENGVQFVRKLVHVMLPYREFFFEDKDRDSAIELHKDKGALYHRGGVYSIQSYKLFKAFIHVGVPDYWFHTIKARERFTSQGISEETSFSTSQGMLTLAKRLPPSYTRNFSYYVFDNRTE